MRPFNDLLSGGFLAYVLVVVVVCAVITSAQKTRRKRIVVSSWILGIFIGPPVLLALWTWIEEFGPRQRSDTAMALFKERCKSAGERIYRKVEGVDGVFLMKIRPDGPINFGDQWALTDPYGSDSRGDEYIRSFLRGRSEPRAQYPFHLGYTFVEAMGPDGTRYRYTPTMRIESRKDPRAPNVKAELERNPKYDLNNYKFDFIKTPSHGARPRFGVTYDDISTGEDRRHWIAGSLLRVIDLETGELVAQRIGYMVDPAQGAQGLRAPWLRAADYACPDFHARFTRSIVQNPGFASQSNQTYDFVEKVLTPTKD